MKRDYQLFLKDIIAAMESIEEFIGDMTLEELKADEKTSSAVIRKFEIVGEASKHIPLKIRDKYTNIKWKSMAGMRDRLIHAYFGIDYNLVWSAIKTEIPNLKLKLKKILSDMKQDLNENQND